MKLRVSEGELYPIYDIGDGFGKEVEVTEEFYKEFTEVMDKFWDMQIILSEIYDSVPDEKPSNTYNFSWEDKV